MKAVVFDKVGKIKFQEVAEPKLEKQTDAIIRITSSAICGTDLHFVRGTMAGMKSGTVLGHEAVGIVEEVGADVHRMKVGDRVVVCSTIACGTCERCLAEDYSQCAEANPLGEYQGTAFFGGPMTAGAFDGLQAERARIPFADTTLVKLPDTITDEQAILLSDIFPTGYFGAKLADVRLGTSVIVFGCGPVGLFAIASAKLLGASRIFAVDTIPSRLEEARRLGAEAIDYEAECPVKHVKDATDGAGVDCAIDAVGVDANRAHQGRAKFGSWMLAKEFKQQRAKAAPKENPQGDNWHAGDGPSQVLHWAVQALRGAGTLGIVGVYPPQIDAFPLGEAMNKNLSVKMGNCPHRRYVPELIELVQSGEFDPSQIVSHRQPLVSVIDAYEHFDKREEGWIKVELRPAAKTRVVAKGTRPARMAAALGLGALAAAGLWFLAGERGETQKPKAAAA